MTGGVNWCDFMSALSKLSLAEAGYYNLTFMERSWSDSWRLMRKEVCQWREGGRDGGRKGGRKGGREGG